MNEALSDALTAADEAMKDRKARLAQFRQAADDGTYSLMVRGFARAAAQEAISTDAHPEVVADAVVHELAQAGCLDVTRPPSPDDALNEVRARMARAGGDAAKRMGRMHSTSRVLVMAVGIFGSFATVDSLALTAGITVPTAKKLLADLVQLGWLESFRVHGDTGPLAYRVTA